MAKSKSFTYRFPFASKMQRAVHVALNYQDKPKFKDMYYFEGTPVWGKISSEQVAGEYLVDGQEITITITKKPLIIPWVMVKKQIEILLDTDPDEVEHFISTAEKSLKDEQLSHQPPA